MSRIRSASKVLSVVGAHLIISPLSMIWLFGSLFTYLESYTLYSSDSSVQSSIHSAWIVAIYLASFLPGMVVTGHIAARIGLKWTGIISMVIFNSSLALTAWTIKFSIPGTIALFGGALGTAGGVTMSVSYSIIQSWYSERSSLLLATASSMFNLFGFIENEIITWYVNPANLRPDVHRDHTALFSQAELLKRVPKVILIIMFINLVLQVLGYLLVTDPPTSPCSGDEDVIQNSLSEEIDAGPQDGQVEDSILADFSYPKPLYCDERQVNEDFVRLRDNPQHQNQPQVSLNNLNLSDATCEPKSLTVSESLRTRVFWVVWLTNFSLMLGALLCNNYYKLFGLVFIPDDQFLTIVGTLMPVISPIPRIIWGWFMDKGHLTVQDLCVASLSTLALFFIFFFHSAQLNRYVYLIFGLFLASAHSSINLLLPVAALTLFGPDHFSANMGMLLSSNVILALWSPTGVTPVLQAFGWFNLFLSCSCINLVTLVIVVFTKFTAQ